ncbi:MAG: diguanylate cyclase [Deinococcus-Thermus bacterium]|nr:diguanylate cyclase [Meiothermus luteus]RMH54519.1 MAG: diguanylate cyclase [Deinococcota bacterium]
MGLSFLPWALTLLGLLPLWFFPRQQSLYPGVLFLLAALLLATAASLYARAPLGPKVRFFWVLGVSSVAVQAAFLASGELAQVPDDLVVTASVASLIAPALFLAGLFVLLRGEALGPLPVQGEGGVLSQSALQALAPSLEALSRVRPVTLLLLHTHPDQPGASLLRFLRRPDLVFELRPGHFLVVLQGSGPEGAQVVFRRIRQSLAIRAYAVLPLQGTVQQVLRQLEGELAHYYLTQH